MGLCTLLTFEEAKEMGNKSKGLRSSPETSLQSLEKALG